MGRSFSRQAKKFKVEFCTVAHWLNGEITEEKLFYDKIQLMKQK